MKVNFEIVDNHALSYDGRHIDLHNNFDFVSFEYKPLESEIRLTWKKSNGEWVDKNELPGLVLIHKVITFLKITGQDESNLQEDSDCLGEITFFPANSREVNNSILTKSKPEIEDDILYFFENGQLVRIHCDEIELIIKEEHLNLTLSKDESLVLFEFLSRFNEIEHNELFEDQAEQKSLWIIEGQLQKQLAEPFLANYKDIIEKARNKIRDEE